MAGHRMTPRRKAALRKAQLASARARRLRRRQRAIKIGIAVTGTALGAAVIGHKIVKGSAKNVTRVTYTKALPPGPNRTRGNPLGYRKTFNPKTKRWESVPPGGVFKVGSGHYRDLPRHVKRVRPAYDAARRAQYKANRPKSTTTRRR